MARADTRADTRADSGRFQIHVDLDHAKREAERVRDLLAALRRRHDLSRYEYTSDRAHRAGRRDLRPSRADARQPLRHVRGPAALHLPARADALVPLVSRHARARHGRPVHGRAGAALPAGADRRRRRRRAQLRRPPTSTWWSTGWSLPPRPSSSAASALLRWRGPSASEATAGSTTWSCATGRSWASSTSATASCRSARRPSCGRRTATASPARSANGSGSGVEARPQRRSAKNACSSAPARTSSIPP